MTRDFTNFSKLISQDGGYIIFGDNNKGKIIGIGNIDNKSNLLIEDVFLIYNLKHNLISTSQFCDRDIMLNLNLM